MSRKYVLRSIGILTCAAALIVLVSATHASRAAVKGTPAQHVQQHYVQGLGSWTAPSTTIDVEVHAAMLYTGKVLVWGILQGGPNPPPTWTPSKLIDPIANTVTDVSPTFDVDFVCAGNSFLPNGNVIMTGGAIVPINLNGTGVNNTTLFNPATETWTQASPMNYPRWYSSNVEMGDGTTITLSGHGATGTTSIGPLESYNQTTGVWTVLPASADNPDGTSPNLLYPRMFMLPNGMLFKGAPSPGTDLFNPATNTWAPYGRLLGTGQDTLFYTSHIQVPGTNTVMVMGGTPSNAGGGTTGVNTTQYIDFSASKPAWQYGPSLPATGGQWGTEARFNQVVLFLADGTVMLVGGNYGMGRYGDPQLESLIYTPGATNWLSGTWATTAAFNNPSGQNNVPLRGYHSVSVLLPDGRVLSTGSTSGQLYDNTYEIFSPAYLSAGTRPTITSAPATASYGQNFTIDTPDASSITSVALIAPTATTHANNMTQRYVPLQFTIGSGSLTATAPVNGNAAPPGYYMLVIVNSTGVPSVASWIQLPLPT